MQCCGDLRRRPRLGRLGVEDARLDAEPLAQQQPGEVLRTGLMPIHRREVGQHGPAVDGAQPRVRVGQRPEPRRHPERQPRRRVPHRRHRGVHVLRKQRVDAVGGLGMHVHRLGARLVRGDRFCGQLLGTDRQIRVRVRGASAVDARLDIDLGAGGHLSIFARRSLSSTRRSRFVGLPAPRSRAATAIVSVAAGLGVRSRKHVAASAAPTRFWITRTTSTTRVV